MPAENKGIRHYLSKIFSLNGLRNLLRPAGLRGLARLLAMGAVVAVAAPVQVLIAGPVFRNRDAMRLLMLKAITRLLGIRITYKGEPIKRDQPMLYIGNHPSWTDAVIMGSLVPGTGVTTKRAGRIPVLRKLVHSCGAIMVERGENLSNLHGQLAAQFNEGRSVFVFPEGEGRPGGTLEVGPFKTGAISVLFNNLSQVKIDKDVMVQPFVIRLTHADGKKLDDPVELKKAFSWYVQWSPEIIWTLVQKKRIDIEVTGLQPMKPSDYADRNEFAGAARSLIVARL